MVRLNLMPRDARFYDLFEQAGANLGETAQALHDLLTDYRTVQEKLRRIEDLEHAGDRCTHEIMRAINQSFITPFDREDIAALSHGLDDVVDQMWAASTRLVVYHIQEPTDTSCALARVLVQQAEALAQALPLLRHRGNMQRILPLAVEVNRLENEADDLLRSGLSGLFADPDSPRDIVLGIKWREIYDFLEAATDKAEDVANVLEALVLKHG